MKTWITLVALLGSISSYAQSFILQQNGSLLTLDTKGFIYDLDQNIDPANVRARGKNWIIEKNGLLTTIDSTGAVFKKPEVRVPRLKDFGGSWYLGDRGELTIITSQGYAISHQDDGLKTGEIILKGANWFVWKNRNETVLFTISNTTGEYFSSDAEYLRRIQMDLNRVRTFGNNWVVDSRGILFVVTRDGAIMSKREMGTFFGITTKGGNYFVDSAGGTRVVLDNGAVYLPYLPMDYASITRTGSTYGWNTRGDFFTFAESVSDAEMRATVTPEGLDVVLRALVKQPYGQQPDPRAIIP